jgi:hypothetical protein
VIDATRAASAHRFAFDPGDDLAHAAMNAGTERYMPATRRVISSRSGRSQRLVTIG